MNNRKKIQVIEKAISNLGVDIVNIEPTGSTHFKVYLKRRADEENRFFVFSSSPSDRRAMLNWKTNVRKWVRNVAEG